MKLSNYLNMRRIGLLLKKDLVALKKQSLIMAGAIFVVYLAIYLLSVFAFTRGGNTAAQLGLGADRTGLHLGFFTPLLFLGGFVVTSRCFFEVHNRVRNHDWLMLPASTMEKFVERWFLTSIGYAVAAAVGYTVFSIIGAGVAKAFFRSSYNVFNPLSRAAVLLCLNYIVGQSLYMLGAVYFRKNHFVKTILVLFGFVIVLTFFAAIVVRLVYWDYFKGMMPNAVFIDLLEELDKSVVPAKY